jgi:hypothetical protein
MEAIFSTQIPFDFHQTTRHYIPKTELAIWPYFILPRFTSLHRHKAITSVRHWLLHFISFTCEWYCHMIEWLQTVFGLVQHTYNLLSLHYPLLGSGCQQRTFVFLRVFELVPASATSFSLLTTVTTECYNQSQRYFDRLPVGPSVLVSSTHLGFKTRFVLLTDSCRFDDVGRLL